MIGSDSVFKKGNVLIDGMFLIIILVALAIIIITANKAGDMVNSEIQADPGFDADTKAMQNARMTEYPTLWDNLFIFIMVLVWAAVLIASFLIDTHPVFFVIAIVALLMLFGAVMIISNVYEDVVSDPNYSSYTVKYPKMHWVLTHFLLVAIVMLAPVILVLYGKTVLT